jgi:hypothetical protein
LCNHFRKERDNVMSIYLHAIQRMVNSQMQWKLERKQ